MMAEYRVKTVSGHVEVYAPNGEFVFSADTVKEAMEELREEILQTSAA